MTKKHSHSNSVALHLFFHVVMSLFAVGAIVFGLIGIEIVESMGRGTWALWLVVGAGVFALFASPIRAWLTWPERDDE